MIYRLIVIFLVFATFSFVLFFNQEKVFCKEKKEISILIGGSLDGWDKIAEDFYKHSGVKVNIVQGPPSPDGREIMYSISFLTKSKGFDIVYLDVVWLGKFASANWLESISNFTNPLEYIKNNNLAKSGLYASFYKGDYYSIPIKADAGLLYYRKDLLEKYGYSVPKTWEELKRIAKSIKDKEGNIEGFVFQGKQYEGLVCNFYEVLRGMGYELIIDDGQSVRIGIKEEDLEKVFRYFRSLIDEGVSPLSVVNFEEEESRILFQQGKAVFARNWPYAIKMLLDDNFLRDKFGVAVLPGQNPTLGGWALAVSKYTPYKKESWEFIDFVVKNGMKTLYLSRGDIPTKLDLFNDPEISSKMAYSDVILKSIDLAKPRTIHPLYPRISNIIQIYLSGVIAGKIDPKTASKKMLKDLQKIIYSVN